MPTHLCLLQVLERWCASPRTIEVLMNTYSVMQLPEEAVDLVPPETLQVRFQDAVARPAPKNSRLLEGSPVVDLPAPLYPRLTEVTQRPSHVPEGNSQSGRPGQTHSLLPSLLKTPTGPQPHPVGAAFPRLPR